MDPEQELIKELESYIEFIGKRLTDLEVFMGNRTGMSYPQELIDEGVKRRAKIAALKAGLEPTKK